MCDYQSSGLWPLSFLTTKETLKWARLGCTHVSEGTLTSEGYVPSDSDRAKLRDGLIIVIHHLPTDDGYRSGTSRGIREGRGIGVKPWSVLRLRQRPIVTIDRMRPIGIQLLECVAGIPELIGWNSPASDDIDIIVHIKILEQILSDLAVNGYVLSIIGSELDLYASDGELAETGSQGIEPWRIVHANCIDDGWIDS